MPDLTQEGLAARGVPERMFVRGKPNGAMGRWHDATISPETAAMTSGGSNPMHSYILASPAALAASPEVQALIREVKTKLVALIGVTATRDTATGEPLMWGDKDGDCLTPEIALQERVFALIREAEARGMERAAEAIKATMLRLGNHPDILRIMAPQVMWGAGDSCITAIRAEAAAIRKDEEPK